MVGEFNMGRERVKGFESVEIFLLIIKFKLREALSKIKKNLNFRRKTLAGCILLLSLCFKNKIESLVKPQLKLNLNPIEINAKSSQLFTRDKPIPSLHQFKN